MRPLDAARVLPGHVGGRPQHDGARHPPAGHEPPVAGHALVLAEGKGVAPVDLGVHDPVPVLVQVARQLVAHGRHVQGEGARHDHGALVARDPQLVDHGGHEPQHAARPLEGLKRCPVLVEPVEHFGVDGVAAHHPVAVLQLPGVHGKVGRVVVVHPAVGVAHDLAFGGVLAVEKEPTAHHLEALARAHGFPDGLHAPEGVLDGLERPLAGVAPDLPVALRDGGHHQAPLARPDRLGQLLDEGDEVVEGPGHEAVGPVELLGVGHQLVHQHQGASAGVEHLLQGLRARRDVPTVGVAHELVDITVPAAHGQLVGDFAPDGVHGHPGQVGRPLGLGRVKRGAHDHGHVHLGNGLRPGRLQGGPHVGNVPHELGAAQEVVEGQHAVGLAAAEGSLQLDHGLAVEPGHPLERLDEQALHALGHVGPPEELHGVAVLQGPLAPGHLGQVGRELGVAVAPLGHVLVGLHYVSPAGQPLGGNRLGPPRTTRAGDLRGRARVGRHRHGPLGPPIARLAQEGVDLGRPVRVDLLAEAAHCVERPPGVVVANVLGAPVCPPVARTLELDGPGPAVPGELAAEYLAPLEV